MAVWFFRGHLSLWQRLSVSLAFICLSACQTTGTSTTVASVEKVPSVGRSVVSFTSQAANGLDSVRISARLFRPQGQGQLPAVVLLHTCGGYRDHITHDWPNYLTGLGYVVLIFDSYAARGHSLCNNLSRRENRFAQSNDAFGALDYLRTLNFVDDDRIAVMGFSAGAFAINRVIVWDARPREENFRAAVSLYGGGCFQLTNYTDRNVPLLVIGAEHDTKLLTHCSRAGRMTPLEVEILEGAFHAFDRQEITDLRHDPFGNPMLYSARATNQARELSKAFLARYLR